MGNVIHLGPLAFPLDRLAAALAIGLFLAAMGRIGGQPAGRTATVGWIAVVSGILVARLAYVIDNRDAFMSDPPSALYIWQGGFDVGPGLVAALVVLALALRARARWTSLATLSFLSLAWFGFAATALHEEPRLLPRVGSIIDLDGAPVALNSRSGPFVVNLWATWCPPCRREMPMLAETAADNPDIPLLLLNQAERPEAIRSYAREQGIDPGLLLSDTDGSLARELEIEALPTTLFVDSGGKIVKVHPGEISRAALLAGVRELKARN